MYLGIGVICATPMCSLPTTFSLVTGLIAVVKSSLDCSMDFVGANGPYTHFNREDVILLAMEQGFTHLQFVDTDVRFPESTIKRLIEHDKDIIGANYNRKEFPLRGATEHYYEHNRALKVPKDEPYRVRAIPCGLMLINLARVNEKMVPPYFDTINNPDPAKRVGEDIYFCRAANEAGLEVWCDPTIKVGHIGPYEY